MAQLHCWHCVQGVGDESFILVCVSVAAGRVSLG